MNVTPYKLGDVEPNKNVVKELVEVMNDNQNNKHILDTEGYGRYLVILFKNRSQLDNIFLFFYGNDLDYSIFKSIKDSRSCLALIAKRNLSAKGAELVENLVAKSSQ